MGALVGLGAGVGLLLIWAAFHVPRTTEGRVRPPRRTARLLERAGLAQVSVTSFGILCLVAAVATTVVIEVVSGTPPVALAFGVMGGYAPVAVVKGRARRRQRDFAEVWPEAVDNLASAVRAGLSLPEALAGLATRGPEPLRPAFDAFACQPRGRQFEPSGRSAGDLGDPMG